MKKSFSKVVALVLVVIMCATAFPLSVFASSFDSSVTSDYFNVLSENKYVLCDGANEVELILNNAEGTDRKVVHYFEVDTKNENIEVLPGYYGIDKLDPDNLALDGIADKSPYWKAEQLTKTVAYYESLGYNVVGAMNTALAYDSDAPYGYMVWDGVVLGSPEVHKGAQTYLVIDWEGNCELRSMSTPLDGSEKTAISANFGWLVKDGVLQTKTVERTSSDASRSMIGIKADGTLVFCQVDGRNAPVSSGLSNYEMGEMMLALGCVNAVNCDGGGSSTFVSKREGEKENTMRSIPSDGSERPTINSVILVSKAKATGVFDHAVLDSEMDYYAPGATGIVTATGVDASGAPAEMPTEGISWALNDTTFGTVENGEFKSNGKKGKVTVQMLYNGEVVGEKVLSIVDPDVFAFTLDETVLPYGKSMTIEFNCTYGADNWAVGVEGAYEISLSNATAATLVGNKLVATQDETIKGVDIVATYLPNPATKATLKVEYGKGSEIVFDFENGDVSNFLGIDEMLDWAETNGAKAPIQNDGNFSDNTDAETFLSTSVVKNGSYALGVTLDYTDADFASWSYNMFFYTGESVVLRDVANGKNATTLGMWVYIPEGAAGLAMQFQGTKDPEGKAATGGHFYFTTVSGAKKNLNSCTEADIPESRWVYATLDLVALGDYVATYNPYGTLGREPSFIRFYIKPTVAANLTFYFDDFTLDYSSAVDDRVLPTISDVSYATQDESVALNNGAAINSNSISFSAIVADNIKIDNATGKIYIDGNLLENVVVSDKYLTTTSSVTLKAGVHTVAFEIKDAMGNTAKVTRTFTVAGAADVILGGHNDSGLMPEYGSVYYVDVNVADITSINKLTTTLKLQTANTWEPQGMVVANGFNVTYSFNVTGEELTLIIERNGISIDKTATTLVSIPVRLWTWDGINHVTDTPITPEAQYKTGYCPIVKIECNVVTGLVNDIDAFGGNISVETKINDTVYAWHYHDKELTILNKEATCIENGYTGRTYCETCQSVVDWGDTPDATGHVLEMEDGVLVCVGCNEPYTGVHTDGMTYANGVKVEGWIDKSYYIAGVKLTGVQVIDGVYYDFGESGVAEGKLTGLFEVSGKTYYAISGNLVKGWQLIEDNWYFFNPSTFAGYQGQFDAQAFFGMDALIYYSFTNGKLDGGVWYQTETGYRYYYGPGCYKNTWAVIDGNSYYFGSNKERLTGLQSISPNLNDKTPTYELFLFTDEGVLVQKITDDGFISHKGDMFYIKDNSIVKAGLIKVDGVYYYTSTTNGKISTNVTRYVAGDCIDASAADMVAGYYTFGADGKMLIEEPEVPETPDVPEEPAKKNGIIDGYYYVDDVVQKLGLFKYEGNYYYASTTNGKLAVNVYRYVAGDCIDASAADMNAGYYTFDADGKVIFG